MPDSLRSTLLKTPFHSLRANASQAERRQRTPQFFRSRKKKIIARRMASLAIATLAVGLGVVPQAQALALPNPTFTSPAEGFGSVGPFACAPAGTFRAGTRAFAEMVTAGTTYTVGGFRACNSTVGIPESQHKTGRATDIGIHYDVASQRADGQQLLDWLFANGAEKLRRLGIVEIIWGGAKWYASTDSDLLTSNTRSWDNYTGLGCLGKNDTRAEYDSACHRDHFHFTLSVAGSEKQTSFWAASSPGTPTTGSAHDLTGDGKADLVGRKTDGSLWYYPGNGNGTFAGSWLIGEGWNIFDTVVVAGDVTGDGKADLVGRKTDGSLWYYPGNGNGTFGAAGLIGTGWNIFDTIVGPGDVTGDGKADLVGRKTDGSLWYYPGNGNGTFGAAGLIGTGWNIFDTIVGPGDVTGDGKADLVGRKTDGSLWYYPGNGNGTFGSSWLIGTGWNIFDTIVGPGDVTGDGKADLVGRKTDGSLWYYPGNGNGTFGSSWLIGTGWNIYSPIV